MSLIGYARVSRLDQDPALQEMALLEAGCGPIFRDKASGALRDRPGLVAALQACQRGDTLVVWKLDRLGRSLRDLINRVLELEARGVDLRCLTQGFDTATPGGRLIFHIFGAVAEFERETIRERTRAALDAARAQGKLLGGPRKLTPSAVVLGRRLKAEGRTANEIGAMLRVSPDTIYRRVWNEEAAPAA